MLQRACVTTWWRIGAPSPQHATQPFDGVKRLTPYSVVDLMAPERARTRGTRAQKQTTRGQVDPTGLRGRMPAISKCHTSVEARHQVESPLQLS